MRLFTITSAYEVELNREWIMLIPEFAALIRRDKRSAGDYRGDKKLIARKELAYIYFCLDFTSPLREWEEEEKHAEALRYVGLEPEAIDDVVMAAYNKYEELLHQSSRSLKTLSALRKGMDSLDKYFKDVDFDALDSLKRQRYTPEAYIGNISKLPKMNAAIQEYERMVEEELKQDTGIRGKATLGVREGKVSAKLWIEGGPPKDDPELQDTEVTDLFETDDEEEDDY